MGESKKNVSELIIEFFEKNPNRDVTHDEAVDCVFHFIPKARDPWRVIRKLHEEGYLIKVRKGVYKRVPGYKGTSSGELFPESVKQNIFKKDNYRCILCGRGLHDGYEIHADHIRPRSKGGLSVLENGQTLCSEHNMLKKNYGMIEFLDKYFEKLLKVAVKSKDRAMELLMKDLIAVLRRHKRKRSDK